MEKQIEADLKCYRDCFLLKRAKGKNLSKRKNSKASEHYQILEKVLVIHMYAHLVYLLEMCCWFIESCIRFALSLLSLRIVRSSFMSYM